MPADRDDRAIVSEFSAKEIVRKRLWARLSPMLPYWVLFGVFAFGAFVGRTNGARRGESSPVLTFCLFLVVLMVGLRFRVGGDWSTYRDIFATIRELSFTEALWLWNSDPAYSLLNWIAHQFGAGIWLINLFCGAALIWGIAGIALRQPNPWLVFVVAVPYLIIVVGMGYTRQAAAIGLTLVAIKWLLKGDLLKFVIAMAIATMLHKSAIILLPIIGLAWTENRFVMTGFVALLGALLYYFFVSASLESLIGSYLKAQLQSEGAAVRVAMNALPASILLLAQKKFKFSELERKVWRNISLAALGTVPGLIALPSSTVVDRLGLYLSVVQLIVLARLPWALGGRGGGKVVLTVLVVAYSAGIQFVWLNYAMHSQLWVPYRIYPIL